MQAGGGGNNEIQQLSAPVATGGTFTLTFDDGGGGVETTSAIPFDATLSQLQSALSALPNVGVGNVTVTGTDGGPWQVEFVGGGLEDTDLPLMSVDGSALTGAPVVTELVSHVAGANEVQTISLAPQATGGQFTLTFGGETTPPLSYDATAAEVQDALQNLASLQNGKVLVTSVNATGGPWQVEFAGRFAATDMPPITGDSSQLSGGFNNTQIVIQPVAASPGVNELQTISMPAAPNDPQHGTFRLTFNGDSVSRTTADLPYNATAGQIQDALKNLDNIGDGNVLVTGSAGGPWTVEFTQHLASSDLPLMTINPSQLSRNDPIEVIEVQQAGATNELQTVTLPALTSGGTFTLQFDDGSTTTTTAPISFDASPGDVQTALEALASINTGDVNVRGGVGDPSVRQAVMGSATDNELQTLVLSPMAHGGSFTLTFDDGTSETTVPLDFDADAATLESALENLPNIGAGNILVSGAPGGPFAIEFTGALGNADQPLLIADGTNLTQLENGPWEIEFTGQYAAQPQNPLVADGTALQLTGLNPSIAELAQGSNGAPLLLKSTHVSEITSIEQLQINGNGGDDQLIITGAPDFPLGVLFDGGDGTDNVKLVSTSSSPSFISPIFPDSTQGVLTMDGRQIQIAGVEGGVAFDAGGQAGMLTFSGTDEANDMRFAGSSTTTATIANDGQVTTTLSGFAPEAP